MNTQNKPYELSLPGSKSITNRALILAALAKGTTHLENVLFAEDTRVCMESLGRLGIKVDHNQEKGTATIEGCGGKIPVEKAHLEVANAGTASRFLTALCALGKGTYTISGSVRMHERPIDPLVAALRTLGITIKYLGKEGSLPIELTSPGAEAISVQPIAIRGDISSQFISALLQIAPCLPSPLTLKIEGELASKPYLEMTRRLMQSFGSCQPVLLGQEITFALPMKRYSSPGTYKIEPDASTAAYFFTLGALSLTPIKVLGLDEFSIQGDYLYLNFLEEMGAKVTRGDGWTTVSAGCFATDKQVFDFNDIPDQVMTAAVFAALSPATVTIKNVANLRVKECDRLFALETEFKKLGIASRTGPDWIEITGMRGKAKPAEIFCYNDHRIPMSFALMQTAVQGITFENPGCVEKSFPEFWSVFENCRKQITLARP